jgi:hypothetical protein
MATKRPHEQSGSDRDPEHESGHDREHEHGHEGGRKFEHDKGNASHIEIEERRFRGGLPPTPELYAQAREQWNQLPGAIVKSPMDQEVPANPPADSENKPAESDEGEKPKEQPR